MRGRILRKQGRANISERFLLLPGVLFLCVLYSVVHAETIPSPSQEREDLSAIARIVEKALGEGQVPGAVVIVGNQGEVVYRQAFGYGALVPERLPMKPDTIFDISSLTKVIVTTTAVMQLVEKGKLQLDAPVKKYWPQFRGKGKEVITVTQLLTHYSGLRPDLDMHLGWSGYSKAMKQIIAERPLCPPGKRFIYSDINFVVLGELVRRISGQNLDDYAEEHIFKPLGMKNTGFKPSPELQRRIAPTQYLNERDDRMLWGEVHDPTARRMGGVSGHAGLFSTADDLALFARMLLDDGRAGHLQILSPSAVKKMTSPNTPPGKKVIRGLGWDIDSPFSSCRGALFPMGSFGHTGFTGTSLWIDPQSKTYVIVLTSRLHPDGKGNAVPLRSGISTFVAGSLGYDSRGMNVFSDRSEEANGRDLRNGRVLTGIDVLEAEGFKPLEGLSLGLISNYSALDSSGRRTVDIFRSATGIKLKALFSPEHGMSAREDEKIKSYVLPETGLPVYSLYGEMKLPTDKMLDGLDALVFDIQDAGARFYTYITTLGYAMEAAARKGIPLYVLDRPNPINASVVQGFLPDYDLKSFTAYFPLPVRHGMTVGELAEMFNEENKTGAKLQVIKMRGYDRTDWFDDCGLSWANPSPNIRSLTQAVLYPGVAMVEGANVSVGRGTDTPFELLGAPWINAKGLAEYLNSRGIQGVRFAPADFAASVNPHKNKICHGVRIILTDRKALDSPSLGIEIISALYRLYPRDFRLRDTMGLLASRAVFRGIKEGRAPESIVAQWQDSLARFLKVREKYLLY